MKIIQKETMISLEFVFDMIYFYFIINNYLRLGMYCAMEYIAILIIL